VLCSGLVLWVSYFLLPFPSQVLGLPLKKLCPLLLFTVIDKTASTENTLIILYILEVTANCLSSWELTFYSVNCSILLQDSEALFLTFHVQMEYFGSRLFNLFLKTGA
jgi:hypothetical protein